MERKKIDLHIHSYYSDGTYSGQEIIDEAYKKGVKVLSITDHNNFEILKEINTLNTQGIEILAGVECDVLDYDINFHILGYGFDVDNKKFSHVVQQNLKLLEEVNLKLIDKLMQDYDFITRDDYESFHYDRKLGGWTALHYFMSKGITNSLVEGMDIYRKYNHSYTCVKFPTINEICDSIHEAKGKAILAHPAKVIKTRNLSDFVNMVEKLMLETKLDGIECYYPSHSKEVTDICLQLCNQYGLIVTCGSDCHGTFEHTTIGELDVYEDQLNLKDIRRYF